MKDFFHNSTVGVISYGFFVYSGLLRGAENIAHLGKDLPSAKTSRPVKIHLLRLVCEDLSKMKPFTLDKFHLPISYELE